MARTESNGHDRLFEGTSSSSSLVQIFCGVRSAASGASEQEIDAVREQRLGPADDPILFELLLYVTDISHALSGPAFSAFR